MGYHQPSGRGRRRDFASVRQRDRSDATATGSSLVGPVIGVALAGSVLGIILADGNLNGIVESARPAAASLGVMRAREPQAGDHWPGCDDARAAGTAPIYRGEPGYSPGMDGDDDGVACEPHRN
ncbi:excalibur calcium-binding domain-containing protein [Novosphingobium album (ex Liu et al. 2023)]|uniref:Excalibur calcium-binding domain-containing protein n=1 Tax=Novosphingobium album (ex Liu et al. 2023) TaxID=3031130 RepID=A0ABT5WJ98_9SPHN|nr:excalibur calcium-binding domain-containing protein [Novosphingobium album (ex Liu et al. 2023)]MDE8650122.1 excalibur calcium-binding domain-containing protein [Novosphingobium album (ex Liu et al. 2023)]